MALDDACVPDERALLLANRGFVYALLARGFAEEPDVGFLAVACSPHTLDELTLVDDGFSDELAAEWRRMCAFLSCGDGHAFDDETLARVRGEYVRIFVGPGTLEAPPWETMHTEGARMLFESGVLDVRSAYRAAGYLPARFPAVADDFVAIELDFMNRLAHEALAAFEAGDDVLCRDRLKHSLYFLERHLGAWLESLACAIEAGYGECLYGCLARIADLYMRRDKRLLRALLDDVGASL